MTHGIKKDSIESTTTQVLYSRLSFDALANANRARLPQFRNSLGGIAHSEPDGSDWTPSDWLEAVVGELGEYANVHKKYKRGDITAEEFERLASKELADVITYLSILAMRALDTPGNPHPTGIDLGQAVINKFNEVSQRVGSNVRLGVDNWYPEGTWERCHYDDGR